jgi:excisionase family DNA binding protein
LPRKARAIGVVEARLMTVREAAQYLAVPVATLYTRVWRREIPFVKLGRSLRFDLRDLDELIEKSKVQPNEQAFISNSWRSPQH